MRSRFIVQLVLGIALVAGVVALGVGVYQAGFAAGLASEGGAVVTPPLGYGYGWGWHGGFGIFGFLGFFLFLFLLFGLFRALAWSGRGWRGGPAGYGRGPWGPGHGPGHDHPGTERWRAAGQDWFDEWHRRAHEGAPEGRPESWREGRAGPGSGEPGTPGTNPR
jgi:hypothetical protein